VEGDAGCGGGGGDAGGGRGVNGGKKSPGIQPPALTINQTDVTPNNRGEF